MNLPEKMVHPGSLNLLWPVKQDGSDMPLSSQKSVFTGASLSLLLPWLPDPGNTVNLKVKGLSK